MEIYPQGHWAVSNEEELIDDGARIFIFTSDIKIYDKSPLTPTALKC